MTADTTETVAEHSARLQPSINLHANPTQFSALYVQLLWSPNVSYPGGMKARVSPVQYIDGLIISIFVPISGFEPGRPDSES